MSFEDDTRFSVESYPCEADGCDGSVVQIGLPGGELEWECDECGWSPAEGLQSEGEGFN